MKRSLFLVLLLFAALSLTVGGTWSAAFGQDRTSPSQTNPPSNPSQPADQPRYEQNQTNSTQPATNNSPRTTTSTEPYETERSAFSWGSLALGLIIGGIAGYLIRNNPRRNLEIRRDRAA